MKQKINRILVMVASAGLFTRGIYNLLYSLIRMFRDYHIKENPFQYLLGIMSQFNMVLLCLGFCGFLLVWDEWGKKSELQNPIRFSQVKKIAFSVFVLFLILALVYSTYWNFISIKTYLIYLSKETNQENNVMMLTWIILGSLTSILEQFGMIFFGLYILFKRQKFRKWILPLYLPGMVYTIAYTLYGLIKNLITYSQPHGDSLVLFERTKMQVLQMISAGFIQILISVASFLIILYGMKRAKEEADRDQNAILGVDNPENSGYTLENR